MTLNRHGQPARFFPLIVYCAALLLRLIPVLVARPLGIGLDDMFQYDMLARSLASGNGFRWYAADDLRLLEPFVQFDLSSVDYDPVRGVETSFRAPLYPAFLALVYFLTGSGADRFFAARLAQAILLGAPLAPLTYFVALRFSPLPKEGEESGLGAGQKSARLAAWVVAAYPILLVYPLGLGTENLFFALLLASFFLLLKTADHSSTVYFLVSGIFLGLTALTRSVILPFAGLAILWAWFLLKQRRGALLMALAFLLTIAPWIVRNSLLHHKPTGIETSMGYNLYLGYHPQGNGSFVFGPSLDLLPILDDAERDQVGTQKALEFIRSQPERFVPLAFNRLGYFFGLEKRVLVYFYSNDLVGFIPFSLLLTLFLVIALPFVVVGACAAPGAARLRWNPGTSLLALLLAGYILPHVFMLSEDRFHLALIPFLAILAAQFWTGGLPVLALRWRDSGLGKLAVLLAALVVLLLFFNWGLEISRDWDKLAQLFSPTGNRSYFPY